MHIRILVFIILIALSCYSVALAKNSILLDRVIAIVNKEAITWSDLYKAMEFEITESYGNISDEDKKRFFKQNEETFLELLVDMRLQLQEAQRMGIFVSPDEVEKAINSIKIKYSLTDAMFIETLKREGFTLEQYKQKLHEKILASRLIDQEVRSKIVIDEDSINNYISQNKELAMRFEGYNLSHIFIKKSNNKLADEEKARLIYNRLKAGEDFSQIAIKYSEDASARSGGELGIINKADLSNEFAMAISKMKEGDISEPFWSANGLHILKLNAVVTADKSAQIREQVRQKLLEERFNRAYKSWLKGLRERAYIQLL